MFVKKKIIMSIFVLSIGTCFSQAPTDVSFCMADVKFDGENLKILEFGDCAESMFTGYNTLYGKGAVWAEFWRYLKKFRVPIWYVGKQ
ncbi:MAG: hypothetical protein KC505_10935, partial [Myxococcales bacterium]|nr:hypothetical protein [Myxococcales bacterium]